MDFIGYDEVAKTQSMMTLNSVSQMTLVEKKRAEVRSQVQEISTLEISVLIALDKQRLCKVKWK